MNMMIFDPVRRHVVNNAQITSKSLLETRMDGAPNEAPKLSEKIFNQGSMPQIE